MEDLILKLKNYPYLSMRTFRLNSEHFRTIIYITEVFTLKVNKYQFKIESRGNSFEESILNAHNELIGIIDYFTEKLDESQYQVIYDVNNKNELIYDIRFDLAYLENAIVVYQESSLKGKIEENVELVKSNLIKKLNSIKESIS